MINAILKYSKEHEWIRKEIDNTYTVGITFYAQDLLGDIVFVDLPKIGTIVNAGSECAVIESIKAASDVYAPISGEIITINSNLIDFPELINSDSYNKGWIFKIKASKDEEFDLLLDAVTYKAFLEEK